VSGRLRCQACIAPIPGRRVDVLSATSLPDAERAAHIDRITEATSAITVR